MEGFILSFRPILVRLKKFAIEIALLFVAAVISAISLTIYLKEKASDINRITLEKSSDHSNKVIITPEVSIFIDVSGAVKNPGLYNMRLGERMNDALKKSGWMSENADLEFFQRNYNLARILSDQEKIYVPSIFEINSGKFVESQKILDYSLPGIRLDSQTIQKSTIDDQNVSINEKISLNKAAIDELDQLPGIGKITANKIISGRPYSSLDELLIKKVINKGVFEKIKALITLN